MHSQQSICTIFIMKSMKMTPKSGHRCASLTCITLITCITCITSTKEISHQLTSWDIINYHWLSVISDCHYLSLLIIDYHWLSLIIIDCHWLSLIIIDYLWLSFFITNHYWLSLIINDYIWKSEKVWLTGCVTDSLSDNLKSRDAGASKNLFCISGGGGGGLLYLIYMSSSP